MKIEVYYYLSDETGEKRRFSVDEFNFRIINFKIKAIDFLSQPLMVDANTEVPRIEWKLYERDLKPEPGVEYNNSVSAPVAVVKNNPLWMTVKYECNGADSLELFASCDGNHDCPFSHINSETIVCNGAGEIEMHSIYSSSTVDAYLSHYIWQITNISYGTTTINQPLFIQSTWHRIYNLYDHPKRYSFNKNFPWIVPLEMIYTSLEEYPVSNSSSVDDFREFLTKANYDQNWYNKNIFFSNKILRKLDYDPIAYNYVDPTYFFGLHYIHSLKLSNLIRDLKSINSESIKVDCRTFNSLTKTFAKFLGIDFSTFYIWNFTLKFNTYKVLPSNSLNPREFLDLNAHMANYYPDPWSEEAYIYDSVFKIFNHQICDYNTQSDDPNCYKYVLHIEQNEYETTTFQENVYFIDLIGPAFIK